MHSGQTATTCDVIIDILLDYRDDNHLTTTYTTWVAPLMGAELDQTLHHV